MKLVRKMRKISSRQNQGAKQDESGVEKEEDEKDKKEILKEENKSEIADKTSESGKPDMRRFPTHEKEKCVSRVTLRIHQLKDKKERGKSDHIDFNCGIMEGAKVVDEPPPVKEAPSEEAPEKEVTPTEVQQPAEQSVSEVQTAAVKRSHSTEDDDEGKKKKRKEESRGKPGSNSGGSPKSGGVESEAEEEKNVESPGPKVPPLKIVISGGALEEPGSVGRNGKVGSGRHHLPYVVATSTESEASPPPVAEADKEKVGAEDAASATQAGPSSSGSRGAHQRSRYNRRGKKATDAGSRSSKDGSTNNGGSVDSSPAAAETESPRIESPAPAGSTEDRSNETDARSPTGSTSGSTSVVTLESTVREAGTPPAQSTPPLAPQLELHPRKRKIRPKDPSTSSTGNTVTTTVTSSGATSEGITTTESSTASHHETVSNSYQLFLNIRKQIERKRKGLFPVQPKPPQGFKDYLMNRCTYLLANNTNNRVLPPLTNPPASLPQGIKDLFISQEKDRHRLLMQHLIEKEKLVLSVEQEILRVHGRAARALANQSLPFSACTILKDEEVYSAITPEQEEKDRNARSRYNGRLFLSWLQDVDDKWEKIKEAMLLRHHNEAESLHAVQKMDWEWKMKEIGMCEVKAKPVIEDSHVPIVHVSDDFDLLQAL